MLVPLSRLASSQASSSSSVNRQSVLRTVFAAAAASCLLLSTPAHAFSTRLAMSAASGPITVVTGSNKGIGLEILKKLAPTSSVAILAARDPARGQAAAQKLREEGLDNVVFRPLDLASSESIRQFAAGMEKDFGRADVLVNNAGTYLLTQRAGGGGWGRVSLLACWLLFFTHIITHILPFLSSPSLLHRYCVQKQRPHPLP